MEYRNSGVNTHLGGGLIAGVDRNAATEVLGSTIAVVSDSNNADLTIKAKGTGLVYVNGTNSISMVYGESSWRPPAMSSHAIDVSTMTMAGVSTGDLIVSIDFRGMLSTLYAVASYTPSSAAECKIALANPTKSTISGSSGRVRWAYLDRT